MSSVNYSLKSKNVRLLSSQEAWVRGKNGKPKLNPNYKFVGKLKIATPNLLITASDNQKPTYKGDVSDLNITAKKQIVSHFYNEKGKRNNNSVAYFAIKKSK
ncbi:MAG: hypothetical protein J6A90_02905 [Clostridia bacterium]|nr:hypothetical protein [Clostridia bacterium]